MTADARTRALLDAVCEHIQDAAEAARIRSMDPADPYTFLEAFCEVRTNPDTPADLLKQARNHLFALADEHAGTRAPTSARA